MKRSFLTPLLLVAAFPSCQFFEEEKPDLGRIYLEAANASADTRRPVIVIPGIMGSKLETEAGTKVWGAFTRGAVDPDYPDGARTFALPMQNGIPLSQLVDDVAATEVLDVLVADIGPLTGLDFAAYIGILNVLNVGGFRDRSLGASGAIDYGGLHYTCYQFPYDWRRDVSESAVELARFVEESQNAVRAARNLAPFTEVKIDVVAHSMGGLVLRYYLRYGAQPLPADGSLPELTWEGAKNVAHAIVVGTPSAGSALALEQLTEGLNLHPLFPNYRPSVLGTFPSIYQLLPRTRHGAVIDQNGEPVDIFQLQTWQRFGWGLADPKVDKALAWLLPESDPSQQTAIALKHLQKCLARAEQLHRALDVPATPPIGTKLALFSGDALETVARWRVENDGDLVVDQTEPGDGTVTRASTLMDERQGQIFTPGLQSPISWARVQFIFADHVGLTSSEEFTDNMLYMLLEEQ